MHQNHFKLNNANLTHIYRLNLKLASSSLVKSVTWLTYLFMGPIATSFSTTVYAKAQLSEINDLILLYQLKLRTNTKNFMRMQTSLNYLSLSRILFQISSTF